MDWTLIPDLSGSGGAEFQSSGAFQAEITPGNVRTNYKVRATSKDNPSFYDEVNLQVWKIDIVETNIYIAISNTVSLHLTPDSSADAQWAVIPSVQDGANIQGSSVGTSIVINAGSIPTNYMVKAYAPDFFNCYDTCSVTVLKASLIQMGFDCTDTNKEVTLRKTGTGSYTNATYSSEGDTTITNPVWLDQNFDHIPDVNPPDPVCFLPGAIPKIAGTVSKLSIQPDIGNSTLSCKLKIEAIPQGAAGTVATITFGPVDLVFSNSTVDLPEIIAAGNETVGSVVNNFGYEMHWKLSTDGGATWSYEFETMTQFVFVVYDKPQTNYCSNIIGWSLPYSWSSLAWTAKRMDWATKQGMGENTDDGMAMKVAEAIYNNPGTPLDTHDPDTYYLNPFIQLDTPDPDHVKMCHRGDCISLANLAATALRLLGINACPCRAYCNNSNDVANSETWGWAGRYTHPVHAS